MVAEILTVEEQIAEAHDIARSVEQRLTASRERLEVATNDLLQAPTMTVEDLLALNYLNPDDKLLYRFLIRPDMADLHEFVATHRVDEYLEYLGRTSWKDECPKDYKIIDPQFEDRWLAAILDNDMGHRTNYNLVARLEHVFDMFDTGILVATERCIQSRIATLEHQITRDTEAVMKYRNTVECRFIGIPQYPSPETVKGQILVRVLEHARTVSGDINDGYRVNNGTLDADEKADLLAILQHYDLGARVSCSMHNYGPWVMHISTTGSAYPHRDPDKVYWSIHHNV